MKLELAQSAGFCYGVRRAVELAEDCAARAERPCVMLGSIIHNQDVIHRLEEQGLRFVERPEDVPEGSCVTVSYTHLDVYKRQGGDRRYPLRGPGRPGVHQS